MATNANFAQVDDYIASQLGATLPSTSNPSQKSLPVPEYPSPPFSPVPHAFSPNPNSQNAAAAQEYQSLQLKLNDALILLDQYKVQMQQQQHRIFELQQTSQSNNTFSSTAAAASTASSLDPEVHYLQQHVITLGGRIEALESLNSSLQSDLTALAAELAASREEVLGLRREGVLSSKHAEQLVQLCGQYKSELNHWIQEHEQLQAKLAAKDTELEAANAKISALEREGEVLRTIAKENAADIQQRVELERQVVEATQAHAATVGRLRNEAMLASQLSEELRAELEYSTELHKTEAAALAAKHESDVSRLQAELVATRSAAASELEAVQEHYATALRALQQQFEQYQGAAEQTVEELSSEYERELAQVRARYRNECLLMSAWAQQSVQAVALAKDARMASLLDSSSTEALVRSQQEELSRLVELHEAQLNEARAAAAQQNAREVYALKRRLGTAQLEASHQQASNRALHSRVSALCAQLSQASQALAASKREQAKATENLTAEVESARAEAQKQTERAEKLQHESLRLKLALEGRLKGSAGSSAVRLQHALQTLESEVGTLRSEMEMRTAQVQHAVAAGERAASRARELERQLAVTRQEYSRVLGLLGRVRRGEAQGAVASESAAEAGAAEVGVSDIVGEEQVHSTAVTVPDVRIDMLSAGDAARVGVELGVGRSEERAMMKGGKAVDAGDGHGERREGDNALPKQGNADVPGPSTSSSSSSSTTSAAAAEPSVDPASPDLISDAAATAYHAAHHAMEYPEPSAALSAAAPQAAQGTAKHTTLSSLQQQLQDELARYVKMLFIRIFRVFSSFRTLYAHNYFYQSYCR